MFKIFAKLKTLFCGPKSEIELVEAALERYEQELDNLTADFDHKVDCCIPCRYDPYYTKLVSKIIRVEKQLERLYKKQKRKHGRLRRQD